MKAKNNHETNDQSLAIEDLSAPNADAIQGGDGQAIYKLHTISHTGM